MEFTNLNLNENLMKGIDKLNFKNCTQVQEKTLKYTLKEKDVFVQSQTGTGKTAAFLITIFQLFSEHENLKGKQAIIIVPTRELAVQIETETNTIGEFLNFNVGSFYGGVGYKKQESMIKNGLDIIIGTPGRLVDLNKSGKLSFDKVGVVVIDEADRLFDMGFLPDLRRMFRKFPPKDKRITLLFSATLNFRVRHLAWEHMNDPEEIEIAPESITIDKIEQSIFHVEKKEKTRLLLGILRREKPSNAIIFTNTKSKAEELSKRLEINGYDNEYIIGDLPQKKRIQIIDDMKNGKIKLLIATDVAARGLNVEDLDLVINFDLPEDCDNYVHRIGRTGRAGKKGKAISLACEKFVYGLEAIESRLQTKIPVDWADEEMLSADQSEGQRINLTRYNDKRRPGDKNRSDNRNKRTTDTRYSRDKNKAPYEKNSREKSSYKKTDNYKKKQRTENITKSDIKKFKKGDLESRVEYYKKKYGDNFVITQEMLDSDKKSRVKKSFLKKVIGLFKKTK